MKFKLERKATYGCTIGGRNVFFQRGPEYDLTQEEFEQIPEDARKLFVEVKAQKPASRAAQDDDSASDKDKKSGGKKGSGKNSKKDEKKSATNEEQESSQPAEPATE